MTLNHDEDTSQSITCFENPTYQHIVEYNYFSKLKKVNYFQQVCSNFDNYIFFIQYDANIHATTVSLAHCQSCSLTSPKRSRRHRRHFTQKRNNIWLRPSIWHIKSVWVLFINNTFLFLYFIRTYYLSMHR